MEKLASQLSSIIMDIDLTALPDDVTTLQEIVRTLAAERANLSDAQAEIERLRLIIRKLQRSQFGRRADLASRQIVFSPFGAGSIAHDVADALVEAEHG